MVRKILYLCIGLFILARDQKTEKKKKKKVVCTGKVYIDFPLPFNILSELVHWFSNGYLQKQPHTLCIMFLMKYAIVQPLLS